MRLNGVLAEGLDTLRLVGVCELDDQTLMSAYIQLMKTFQRAVQLKKRIPPTLPTADASVVEELSRLSPFEAGPESGNLPLAYVMPNGTPVLKIQKLAEDSPFDFDVEEADFAEESSPEAEAFELTFVEPPAAASPPISRDEFRIARFFGSFEEALEMDALTSHHERSRTAHESGEVDINPDHATPPQAAASAS
jgi:hypothetical protein